MASITLSNNQIKYYNIHMIEYITQPNEYLYIFGRDKTSLQSILNLLNRGDNIILLNNYIFHIDQETLIDLQFQEHNSFYFLSFINLKKESAKMLELQIFSDEEEQLLWNNLEVTAESFETRLEITKGEVRIWILSPLKDNDIAKFRLNKIPKLISENPLGKLKLVLNNMTLIDVLNQDIYSVTFSYSNKTHREELIFHLSLESLINDE